eukprot:2839165-Pleurochrysis_carterae.AAC.1
MARHVAPVLARHAAPVEARTRERTSAHGLHDLRTRLGFWRRLWKKGSTRRRLGPRILGRRCWRRRGRGRWLWRWRKPILGDGL